VLEQWEPLIAAAVAVAGGSADDATRTDLDDTLSALTEQEDLAALVPVMRQMIDGNTDTDLTHLDPVDTAIATALRRRILHADPE
jgi:hypothetical protein